MALSTAPAGWSQNKLDAFNRLMEAVSCYEQMQAALQALGITNGPYITARNDVAALIQIDLGPAFLATN